MSALFFDRRRHTLVKGEAPMGNPCYLELKDRTITAAIVAPIMVRAELVGVLTVSSRTQGARYDQEDLQALSVFAENAGTCIDLMEWIERTKRMNQKPKGAPTPSETEKQKSAI